MRRLAAAALAALAVLAVLAAPTPPDPVVAEEYRTVGSALLACPALAVTDDSANLVTGLVAPAQEAPVGPAGTAEGSAVLRRIDADLDAARVGAPGEPVSLVAATQSQPPVLMLASGAYAPATLAGVASHELGGAGAGLASAQCVVPGPEWWFVGAGSQLGRGSALLVSNPAQEPARFDIRLFARSGPVEALAGSGINLGPRSGVRLRLDALAQGEELLALQVRTRGGRVAAALRDVSVPRGEQPRGVDFIPPAVPPSTTIRIGGIPGGDGSRDLVLVNPGEQFATLRAQLLTEEGAAELPGLSTIAVPAGSVISTSLDRVLNGRAGTLELTSDVPITGGIRSDWGGARRDTSWLAASPSVRQPDRLAGAAVVPAGAGLRTTVTVIAPRGPVSGTLDVLTTGEAEESLFTRDGPLAEGSPGEQGPNAPGLRLATGPVREQPRIQVSVPAGSQRTVALPDLDAAAAAHLVWTSTEGSGPVLLSHLTLDPDGPTATGYSWWPVRSAVAVEPVREDPGALLPRG